MFNLSNINKRINIKGTIHHNYPLSKLTSFRSGGPAEVLLRPKNINDIIKIKRFALNEKIPVFILGEGANILVSDKGIKGIVLDMRFMKKISIDKTNIISLAGASVKKVCEKSLSKNLSGLEFIYGMPGSIGGSIWMNARCYDISISELLLWVETINDDLEINKINININDFSYKRSPFQKTNEIIYRACFSLKYGNKKDIKKSMFSKKNDRKQKGHYLYPSAGSTFKNNRDFGKPTGKIIDEIGLKGFKKGNVQIADFHGNIIINTGLATSREIKEMIEFVEREVKQKTGFVLEREVILVGEW